MKKQIVFIGGGRAFKEHEAYLHYLQTKPFALDDFRLGFNWRNSLQERLGGDFDVLIPPMPNTFNARYHEWKIWFERIVPFLEDEVVLIGHSLGGVLITIPFREYVSKANQGDVSPCDRTQSAGTPRSCRFHPY